MHKKRIRNKIAKRLKVDQVNRCKAAMIIAAETAKQTIANEMQGHPLSEFFQAAAAASSAVSGYELALRIVRTPAIVFYRRRYGYPVIGRHPKATPSTSHKFHVQSTHDGEAVEKVRKAIETDGLLVVGS